MFIQLSKLLTTSLELLRGGQSLHFTALSIVNRIIDMCIVHKNYELLPSVIQTESSGRGCSGNGESSSTQRSPKHAFSGSANNRHDDESSGANSTFQKIPTVHFKKSDHEKHQEKHEEADSIKTSTAAYATNVLKSPLEILTSYDPSQILSVLHNSITMHKRIIGTRQKCTPSTRWRHCTHHCLQILSARILVVMCHGGPVQHRIIADGYIKTLVEALDPNHDPVCSTLLIIFKMF